MCKSSYYSGDKRITLHVTIFFIAIPKLGFLQGLRSERTCISKLKLLSLFVCYFLCKDFVDEVILK